MGAEPESLCLQMNKRDLLCGMKVRFSCSLVIAPLTACSGDHLLSNCVGEIVVGPNSSIFCYPDYEELDLVWVQFPDDIRPLRQISAAWLEVLTT
jgi:hypothetical protein